MAVLFFHPVHVIAIVSFALALPTLAMPQYRIDIRIDGLTIEDLDVCDLPDDLTAEVTAGGLVAAIVRDVFRGQGDHEVDVDVTSGNKRVVTVAFRMVTEVTHHSSEFQRARDNET